MNYTHNERAFNIKRYPSTTNRSLQPWNAADELMLEYIDSRTEAPHNLVLFNDRFGFLATTLFQLKPISVVDYKSHYKAIDRNYTNNSLVLKSKAIISPFGELSEVDLVAIKIPKSTEEFEFFIQKAHRNLNDDGIVICGFMTKYFTSQWLEIAHKYFSNVEQSKAKKKARIFILKEKKNIEPQELKNDIEYKGKVYEQYAGVFSSNHIDYATQFFLENVSLNDSDVTVLDLASGNGVIADQLQQLNSDIDVHLLEDSFLAIESSKKNIHANAKFTWDDSLDTYYDDYFDLVVSNPPFHFEFENNIEVALSLFVQVQRCLKSSGRFLLVANQHLNYKTHLDKLFTTCSIIAENEKFVVYECLK